eukprot:6471828-Amphidinium_carterae.1
MFGCCRLGVGQSVYAFYFSALASMLAECSDDLNSCVIDAQKGCYLLQSVVVLSVSSQPWKQELGMRNYRTELLPQDEVVSKVIPQAKKTWEESSERCDPSFLFSLVLLCVKNCKVNTGAPFRFCERCVASDVASE